MVNFKYIFYGGEGKMDFVAIDFETANEKRNSACSMGITVVENNSIVLEKYFLIRPCEMRFLPMNIWIHGITPEDVEGEKNFAELWEEIKPYIADKFIIAHNAGFDVSVLRNTLDFYGIEYPEFQYACSVVMSKNYYIDLPNHKLNTVSEALGFEFKHHHAGADATAAANILINICKDLNISTIEELALNLGLRIGQVYKGGYSSAGSLGASKKHKKFFDNISKDVKSSENNIFLHKVVVFTGPLSSMNRMEAMRRIKALGGVIGSSVTKKTNYLITGIKNLESLSYQNKSGKMKKAENLISGGQDIKIMNEDEFLKIINYN